MKFYLNCHYCAKKKLLEFV